MSDAEALSALETLSSCGRYARWLFDLAEPYLGERVVEAGAGLGTQSRLLAEEGVRRVMLTDADPARVKHLEEMFASHRHVSVREWRLPEPFGAPEFKPDTFVAWNVLEHVDDDTGALDEMFEVLPRGGRVVIFSPAGRFLMSEMDRRMGHFRRYARGELSAKARFAGFEPITERRVNLLGVVGWFLNAHILAKRELPAGQSRAFDLLVPLLRLWEDRLPVPAGLSVLMAAAKP